MGPRRANTSLPSTTLIPSEVPMTWNWLLSVLIAAESRDSMNNSPNQPKYGMVQKRVTDGSRDVRPPIA